MKDIHNQSTSRITTQQQLIYQFVMRSNRHYSAEQVYSQIRKTMPRISLATVYRNLERLASRQMIGQVTIKGKLYFERQIEQHYHVICLACNKIENLDSLPASDIESFFSRSTTYTLISHELVLYGLCVECQQAR